MSKIEDMVCVEFDLHSHNDEVVKLATKEWQSRAKEGKRKYDTTLERTDLTKLQWFKHLREELLDACNYATRLEFEDLSFAEEAIIKKLKNDLFDSLEKIYENSLLESELSEPQGL